MSYHNITIVGNAGQDADFRYLPDGTPVVNVSVAVNERFNGEDTTTWYRVAFWGNLTKGAQHITKGQSILVEGRPMVDTYTDRQGNFRANIKVNANTMRFIGGRPPEAGPASAVKAPQTPEELAEEIPF